MISPFSSYEPRHSEEFTTLNVGNGGISGDDELFITKLLSSFVNKQSALFQQWIKVRITEYKNRRYNDFKRSKSKYKNQASKQPNTQLLILTPLKIITLPSIAASSSKRMKEFRIIDIVSLFVEENSNSTTCTPHDPLNPNDIASPTGSGSMHRSKKKILNKPKKQYNATMNNNNNNNDNHLKSPRRVRKRNIHPVSHSASPSPRQQQTQRLKILQSNEDKKRSAHHASASSSSQSHSLSPQPSTSYEQLNSNGIGATITSDDVYDDGDDSDVFATYQRQRKKANTFGYDVRDEREHSKSHSKSISKSISKSKSKTSSRSYHAGASWMSSYNNWIYHCCIQFHRLDVLDLSYEKLSSHHMNAEYLDLDILDIYFETMETAKEFVDILQFYLFTLYRGVPFEYKPKIEIIPHQLNDNDIYQYNSNKQTSGQYNHTKHTKYPFVPSQVFIDRYVAYCDAQQIPALDSVIDYVIHTNNDDIFDVAAAFSHHLAINNMHAIARNGTMQHTNHTKRNSLPFGNDPALKSTHSLDIVPMSDNNYAVQSTKQAKGIQQQQYVALGHALAFLKMYKKLCVDRLDTDDANIATLMKIYETNPYITACEFRKCAIKKITMQSLSISLRAGVANLKELSIIDIHITRSILKDLDLDNCNLSKLVMAKCNMSEKAIVYLFNELMKTGQYKTMQHLNISYNHCDKDGTNRITVFLKQSLNIQKLIVNDARCDGNILFNGLHLNSYNNMGIRHHLESLSYLDFSGNSLGDKGARKLSNFIQSAHSLKCLKLSRCNMTTQQLHKIFEGALANNSGFEDMETMNVNMAEEDHEVSLQFDEEEEDDDAKQYEELNHIAHVAEDIHNADEDKKKEQMAYRKANRSKSAALPKSTPQNKYKLNPSHYENRNILLSYRPTRCDIIQCRQLVRLTLDISYNNLGGKGAEILCEVLRNRLLDGNIGNYTIVSLCLAGNGFDVLHLSNILRHLHCCVCLESLNISDNIKQNKYFNIKTPRAGDDTKKKGEPQLGQCLVDLCRRATNLERLIFNSNDLSDGMEPFLSAIAYLSNLKYIDLSNNKFGDKHISLLIDALSYNRTFIRALKISHNKISNPVLIGYMQLLSSHPSLIDVSTCVPHEQIEKYSKMKKYAATFTRLENEASLNLRGNKFQYDIDKKMVASLSWRERAEKQLRLQCGQQFGIPLESVRGTVKFIEYNARIPRLLVNLRNYLKAKGGFEKQEIFRFAADATKFELFKRDLNANAQNVKTDDIHSIANAIKAFYHDLPIKVLNNVNIELLRSVETPSDVQPVMEVIAEPYKSLFEWLLDLCVDIVTREAVNKMTTRSMAVVLCPSLYNAYASSPDVNISPIVRVVSHFTDLAVQWRIEYRAEKGKIKYEEEWIRDPNDRRTIRTPQTTRERDRKMNYKDGDCFKDQVPWRAIQEKWDEGMKDMNEEEMEQQAWNECTLYSHQEPEENKCCYSIQRLTFILVYFKQWLMKRNINPLRQSVVNISVLNDIAKYHHPMRDFIDSLSHYSHVALLNDFHHVLRHHASNEELEDIMVNVEKAMSGNGCCAQGCTSLIRNNRNRDRDKNRPRKMKIYYGYKRSAEICTQQLLDKIHCYLLHTFDTLRFTKYERTQIEQAAATKEHKKGKKSDQKEYEMYRKFLQPKGETLGQIRGNHRVKGTKFSSNISDLIQKINNNPMLFEEEEDEEDEDDDEEEHEYDPTRHVYTLGQPFEYTENEGERSPSVVVGTPPPQTPLCVPPWLVKKKYNNFKEEMLHNNIRQICCDSWNDSYFKALILQKTSIAKKIVVAPPSPVETSTQTPPPNPTALSVNVDGSCSLFGDELALDVYRIIPIQHVMAVLLYCDFDNLRFSFHKTFYPQSIDESMINWKLRNAEYYHWSAYLKDAVANCSGIDLNDEPQTHTWKLYHSSTDDAFLPPKYMSFCYPISFNKHLAIVDTFAPKNGIIFAFEARDVSAMSHFNCCWISDYANYDEEIIFCNNSSPADNYLRICNILDVGQCTNYKSFWNAMQIFSGLIHGDACNLKMYNEEDIECLSLLIESQLQQNRKSSAIRQRRSIPPYMELAFGAFCSDYVLGQITLNPTHFESLANIQKHLFDDSGWCKLKVFCCKLFVHLSSIKIMNHTLNAYMFDDLHSFLSQFYYFDTNSNSKRRGAIQKTRSSVLQIADNTNYIPETAPPTSSSILSLKDIRFVHVNEESSSSSLKCKECVSMFYMKFNQMGWNMRDVGSCLYIERIN